MELKCFAVGVRVFPRLPLRRCNILVLKYMAASFVGRVIPHEAHAPHNTQGIGRAPRIRFEVGMPPMNLPHKSSCPAYSFQQHEKPESHNLLDGFWARGALG